MCYLLPSAISIRCVFAWLSFATLLINDEVAYTPAAAPAAQSASPRKPPAAWRRVRRCPCGHGRSGNAGRRCREQAPARARGHLPTVQIGCHTGLLLLQLLHLLRFWLLLAMCSICSSCSRSNAVILPFPAINWRRLMVLLRQWQNQDCVQWFRVDCQCCRLVFVLRSQSVKVGKFFDCSIQTVFCAKAVLQSVALLSTEHVR